MIFTSHFYPESRVQHVLHVAHKPINWMTMKDIDTPCHL